MNSAARVYARIRQFLSRTPIPPVKTLLHSLTPGSSPAVADVTVFVTTIGDQENFADCMSHLQAQTVRPQFEIIDHVAPLSAAFQEMHKRCCTPYYVQVDEDMILVPDAIATMRDWIRSSSENVAMVCAPLWDCDAERPIYGLKIYRSSIVKKFPYQNTLSCEITQLAQIKQAGYRVILLPLSDRSTCMGEHGKHYTPESIFKRWQRCFQKHQQYSHMAWIEPYAHSLLDRYVATGKTLHLYAFLGAVAGMVGAVPPDSEADWRSPNYALEHIKRYFPTDG